MRARIGAAIDFVDFLRGFDFEQNKNSFPVLGNIENKEALIGLFFQMMSRDRDNFSGNIPIEALRDPNKQGIASLELFRIKYSQLGVAFAKLHSDDMYVNANRQYTVGDWLHRALFSHLIPLIRDEPNEKRDDYHGLSLLRKYSDKKFNGKIGFLGSTQNSRQLISELSNLFDAFRKIKIAEMNAVLVEYDSEFNVKSGIASPEHPVIALKRRVFEFNDALGL